MSDEGIFDNPALFLPKYGNAPFTLGPGSYQVFMEDQHTNPVSGGGGEKGCANDRIYIWACLRRNGTIKDGALSPAVADKRRVSRGQSMISNDGASFWGWTPGCCIHSLSTEDGEL